MFDLLGLLETFAILVLVGGYSALGLAASHGLSPIPQMTACVVGAALWARVSRAE